MASLLAKCVHQGGMATLWSATRPDLDRSILTKIPKNI